MKWRIWGFGIAVVLFVGLRTNTARCDGVGNAITITVDENGGSSPHIPFSMSPDPGPGGLSSVLTYNLAALGLTTTQGDVLFNSPSDPGILFGGDVFRFNGTTLVVYSDVVGGDAFDSLGDTFAPPFALYGNTITVQEVGGDANNFALYTPAPGQPGFVAGETVTYKFISDGTVVPEAGSLLLLGSGLLGVAGWRRLRHLRS